MESVFVAGSRALSKLNAQVKARLNNIVRQNFTVLVGDANGADKAVQRYLADLGYKRVAVYCMEICRNNIGNWPTHPHKSHPDSPHDRHYYGIKDLAMVSDSSCGFMIWDGASKGTITNVINLINAGKTVLLYAAPTKQFLTLRTHGDLNHALTASGIEDVNIFLASLTRKKTELAHSEFAFPR